MAFCPNCGANLPDGTAQCPQCGAAMNAQQPQQNTVPQTNYQKTPPQGQPYQQVPTVYQQTPPQGQPYQQVPPVYQQMPPQGQPYQQVPPGYQQMPMGPAPIPPGYQQKSKLAAGLLGIFLGSLGVHNFYLGYTGKAVGQLLLTLIGWIACGLGPIAAAVWGLVEGIMLLTGSIGTDGKNVPLKD